MQLRIAAYNSRKLATLQRPPYVPVYDDESSGESSSEDRYGVIIVGIGRATAGLSC